MLKKIEGYTFLIIEEDPALRDKARSYLLINKAAHIFDAKNFSEAYNKTSDQAFDFCICDYRIFNSDAQTFIKKLRKEKKITSDDQLIMSSDFFEHLEGLKDKKEEAQVDERQRTLDEILNTDVSRVTDEIMKPFCQVKAFMLVKSSNEAVEATVLNIDSEELIVTISTNSLEKLENYARQIKFESDINRVIKNYTIIGDMRLVDDSDQFFREFELSVPEQYKEILDEIETDLFAAQRKTKDMLAAFKGEFH